jgi:hypothetical protein
MLEYLYEYVDNRAEVKSVTDFHSRFIKGSNMENDFFKAVRETRLAGFREGVKTAVQLLTEILETDRRANG